MSFVLLFQLNLNATDVVQARRLFNASLTRRVDEIGGRSVDNANEFKRSIMFLQLLVVCLAISIIFED